MAGHAAWGGVDKTMLDVGGATLLDRVLDALGPSGRVVVVGEPRPVGREVCWTREHPVGGGPVAGLAAGLREVTADLVVVVAGDLPFLDAGTVRELQRAVAGHRAGDEPPEGAILVDATGRGQPLVGCWVTSALRRVLPPDPAGASMWRLIAPLRVIRMLAGTTLLDCDTPYELDAARAIAARREGKGP